ncbi:transcription factor Spi-B isoform X6 [Arvicanthis niloticus]|uniref:transcription factor Spi-B isoform X6 n=1 Tax=Arvicanthis niloticus TaxID=61156 RepID=UPI00403D522F
MPLCLSPARLDGPHLSCLVGEGMSPRPEMTLSSLRQYPEGVFYDLDSCKPFSYPDSDGGLDCTWGWTEAAPAPAIAPYEAFDPATAAFAHSQAVQLCYGQGPSSSTYSPVGTLDPAPSLEAPGPGLQVYPSEDFTSQTLGSLAYAPYPSPVLSEEEDILLDSPTLEVSDSESDEALLAGSEGRGSEVHARSCDCTSSCWGCSCAGTCESAYGGWSQVPASSSSPPSTRSCWLAAGASRRATASA